MVFAFGDWHGGCALYAVDGELRFTVAAIGESFTVQAKSPLGSGRHRLAVSFVVDDDSAGELTLSADGETLDSISADAALGKRIVTAPSQGVCASATTKDSRCATATSRRFSGRVRSMR